MIGPFYTSERKIFDPVINPVINPGSNSGYLASRSNEALNLTTQRTGRDFWSINRSTFDANELIQVPYFTRCSWMRVESTPGTADCHRIPEMMILQDSINAQVSPQSKGMQARLTSSWITGREKNLALSTLGKSVTV